MILGLLLWCNNNVASAAGNVRFITSSAGGTKREVRLFVGMTVALTRRSSLFSPLLLECLVKANARRRAFLRRSFRITCQVVRNREFGVVFPRLH